MDTRSGTSERLLASAALADRGGPCRVLIGGLGVGYTLVEALAQPACAAVTVVEVEAAVIEWQRRWLGPSLDQRLDDARVTVVCADLLSWLDEGVDRYDVVCLDIDNGPGWTVFDANTALYGEAGLALVAGRLAPGGTVAVWSAAPDPGFAARLGACFGQVRELRVPVPRGEPDVAGQRALDVTCAGGLTAQLAQRPGAAGVAGQHSSSAEIHTGTLPR